MLSSAIVKLTSAKPFKAIRFHKNNFKKQTTADWLCIFLLTGLLYACYPVNSKKKRTNCCLGDRNNILATRNHL